MIEKKLDLFEQRVETHKFVSEENGKKTGWKGIVEVTNGQISLAVLSYNYGHEDDIRISLDQHEPGLLIEILTAMRDEMENHT